MGVRGPYEMLDWTKASCNQGKHLTLFHFFAIYLFPIKKNSLAIPSGSLGHFALRYHLWIYPGDHVGGRTPVSCVQNKHSTCYTMALVIPQYFCHYWALEMGTWKKKKEMGTWGLLFRWEWAEEEAWCTQGYKKTVRLLLKTLTNACFWFYHLHLFHSKPTLTCLSVHFLWALYTAHSATNEVNKIAAAQNLECIYIGSHHFIFVFPSNLH